MFTADTYTARRARLSASMSSGLLLFLGNDDSPMNYTDNTYHFRQDSTWLYYFGVAQPGLAAVIDLDAGRTVVFAIRCTSPSWRSRSGRRCCSGSARRSR